MKKYLCGLICALFLAGALPVFAQKEENCLLWRITGNGLARPSYLFGTIHLKAHKLFDFPDSLYTAIGSTEVFALEINFDSINSELGAFVAEAVEEQVDKKLHKKEKKLKELLTKEEMHELRAQMAENADTDPDDLTTEQFYLMKDQLLKHTVREDDMPEFMDLYLLEIAKDKGRAIGGLEHLSDQLNLLFNLQTTFSDPKMVLKMAKSGTNTEEQLVDDYLAKDLGKMQELSASFSPETEQLFITARNQVMLRSMDSIMHKHSLFTAVGTLHLPGSKGLISLLRARGYKVARVICPTTTHGAEYQFHEKKATGWYEMVNEDSSYSIKMPGKPGDMNMYDGLLKMKSYLDATAGAYYMSGHMVVPEGANLSSESLMKQMQQSMTKGVEIKVKNVVTGGLHGKECTFTDKEGRVGHLQLLAKGKDVFLLMVYTAGNSTGDMDKFFKSFRVMGK